MGTAARASNGGRASKDAPSGGRHIKDLCGRAVERSSGCSRCKSGPRNCRWILVATWAARRATDGSKPQGHGPTSGGSASVRAATRVKSEQAPKGLMWESSRPTNGEDPSRSEQITEASKRAHRGIGRSMHASTRAKHGRPARMRAAVRACNGSSGAGSWQESEEPIVVMKPSNAGGAKGLWFGVRPDEAEGGGLA